jgi:hypothetical protein
LFVDFYIYCSIILNFRFRQGSKLRFVHAGAGFGSYILNAGNAAGQPLDVGMGAIFMRITAKVAK